MPCANPNGSFSSFIASEVLVRYASSTRIAGICVRRRTYRLAVDADEVIRRPLVRQPHALSQTGGVACAEDLLGCVAAQPHLKPRIGPQEIGQIHADRVGHILLEQFSCIFSLREGAYANGQCR